MLTLYNHYPKSVNLSRTEKRATNKDKRALNAQFQSHIIQRKGIGFKKLALGRSFHIANVATGKSHMGVDWDNDNL